MVCYSVEESPKKLRKKGPYTSCKASYISPCKKADPNFSECAVKQANDAVPHLIDGDKEHKIPKLDPLKLSKLELNSGANLKLTLTDLTIVGLNTFHATKIELHDNYVLLEHTLSKIVLTVDLQFFDKYFYELYKKPDGKQYPKRTGLEINVTARDAKFHLDNLFNGNKQLGDNMNKLLNENPQEVLRDLGFSIAKEVAGLMVGSVVDAIISLLRPKPIYIKPCKRATVAKDDCALESAKIAIPQLIKGDSEYKIPPLSPVKIPRLELNSGPNLKMTLNDVSLLGLDTINVLKMEVDPSKKTVTSKFSNLQFTLIGQYEISGQILVLPITGSGPANITLIDTEFDYVFGYELIKKDDGKEYASVTTSESDFIAKTAQFHLGNLFNGNKALGDSMNQVLNDNPQEVLRDIGYPLAQEVIRNVAFATVSSILSTVPYDALIPV
ncbi:hypothetical protein HUJ05_006604 [Dendroctonus ponderosae]|nr:hypothetical protein HUJ05_006604 [Dendroctonus ponderosae]